MGISVVILVPLLAVVLIGFISVVTYIMCKRYGLCSRLGLNCTFNYIYTCFVVLCPKTHLNFVLHLLIEYRHKYQRDRRRNGVTRVLIKNYTFKFLIQL